MSRRPDRWWRPSTLRRPPQRARARHLYTEEEMTQAFDIAYQAGMGDQAKRSRERDEQLRRLAEACEAKDNGDPRPFDELMREAGIRPPDDLLDVPDAAEVTPLVEVDGEQLAAEFERWLADQGGTE